MTKKPPPIKGRGALSNAGGRFELHAHEAFDDGWNADDLEPAAPGVTVTIDSARTALTYNDSPDIGFDRSINAYRGCEHGCIYCFARPTHAYLGLSPGLDFETRLFAKPNAAVLLEKELRHRNYVCRPIALGTNTDPYQPIERQWRITRQILEVLAAFSHPVTILTKSARIERDIDILAPMAARHLVEVRLSVTTMDSQLARRLEPRATAPLRRIEVIKNLNDAGIPTGVMIAPIIPVLTDPEMEDILEACVKAGAQSAGYVMLRLPLEVKDLFKEWLAVHEPLKAEHVMSLVRGARGGKENDPHFSTRMVGTGPYADLIAQRFTLACKKFHLNKVRERLNTSRFRTPQPDTGQLTLF
ncbi:MAG: PA0069 family radical SAM protein [Gammaproteobacteria bacterium]